MAGRRPCEAMGRTPWSSSQSRPSISFVGDEPAGGRRERDCRVHDGDVAARVAGQRSDDRQSVDRHRSHSDADVAELDVVCAAEHVLEPLQRGVSAALQLVLVRRPGRREKHPVLGLAKVAPGAVEQPAKQTG